MAPLQRPLLMRAKGSSRTVPRMAAKAIAAACVSAALLMPAYAQFWGWGNPPRQQPRYQQQQPYSNPFGGGWFGQPEYRQAPPREAPVDYSRAPAPPRKQQDAVVTTPVVVMGDAMADWLAYGLEDAFAEKPEMGVVRKHRTTSGLIRYEQRRETEWAQVAREIIAAEKPKFIVMMIGVNDRQAIRERAPAAAAPAARGAPKGKAAAPAAAPAQPSQADPELQAQQSADQQNSDQQQNAETQDGAAQPAVAAPEPARGASGTFEFHTEKWEAAYIKRIDATIAALKSANVPVFWVGLPSQRNARAMSDSAYLNELYRQRAERAGIVYVDVWDGFVDDGGRFNVQGPDFEGQTRRLRAGDGVYFTKAGARKLAHYVEREIQRNIANRTVPIALPAPEPAVLTPGARPSGPALRPAAGPVVPLTTSFNSGDELMGGGRAPRPVTSDPVAIRVLTKGEPISAPNGRADDFSWPRNNVETAAPGATPVSAPTASAPAAAPPAAATPPRTGQAAPSSARRANAEGQAADPDAPPPAPVRRRPRPPATDNAPRPPLGIGPPSSQGWNGWRR
jgi:hypothetical protein